MIPTNDSFDLAITKAINKAYGKPDDNCLDTEGIALLNNFRIIGRVLLSAIRANPTLFIPIFKNAGNAAELTKFAGDAILTIHYLMRAKQ